MSFGMLSLLRRCWVFAWLVALSFVASPARGAPEAKLLRIDPRASLESGNPIITTVIEVAQSRRGVGTAWLILVDADRRMGGSFQDAKHLASRFVDHMGPNDIVNLMFFNDRQVVRDSQWLPTSKQAQATRLIDSIKETYASTGRNRLASISSAPKAPASQTMPSIRRGPSGTCTTLPTGRSMPCGTL